jgi:hypothetical protein
MWCAARDQRNVITRRGGPPDGRIDAVFRLGTSDDQMADPLGLQLMSQVGVGEGVRPSLMDDKFSLEGRYTRVNLPASTTDLQRMSDSAVVLNKHHRDLSVSGACQQCANGTQHSSPVLIETLNQPALNIDYKSAVFVSIRQPA